MLIEKKTLQDLLILSIRILLAFIFIDYGYAKLVHNQFDIYDKSILDLPLKRIHSFYLSWYLFGLEEPFKYIIGIMQIATGILLLFERSVLIGAILYIPLIIGIILINISFIKIDVLIMRTINYLILDLIILYSEKERMIIAFRALLKTSDKLKKRYKKILLALILAILIELTLGALVNLFFYFIHKLNA